MPLCVPNLPRGRGLPPRKVSPEELSQFPLQETGDSRTIVKQVSTVTKETQQTNS